MKRAIVVCLALAASVSTCLGATEQEVTQTLTQRLRTAFGEYRGMCGLHELRMAAALTMAADKRELDLGIARQQLAADMASAAAGFAGLDPQIQPAQVRGTYVQGLATAVSLYQQTLGAAHQEWANTVSQAFTKLQQEEAAALNALQQTVAAASQSAAAAIPAIPADQAPDVAFGLPDLTGQPVAPEAIAAAEKALTEARVKYREEINGLLAAGYAELKQAITITAVADRTAAIRKAVNKLRMVCLDRHDQYDSDVRAIIRKAILQATQ